MTLRHWSDASGFRPDKGRGPDHGLRPHVRLVGDIAVGPCHGPIFTPDSGGGLLLTLSVPSRGGHSAAGSVAVFPTRFPPPRGTARARHGCDIYMTPYQQRRRIANGPEKSQRKIAIEMYGNSLTLFRMKSNSWH